MMEMDDREFAIYVVKMSSQGKLIQYDIFIVIILSVSHTLSYLRPAVPYRIFSFLYISQPLGSSNSPTRLPFNLRACPEHPTELFSCSLFKSVMIEVTERRNDLI